MLYSSLGVSFLALIFASILIYRLNFFNIFSFFEKIQTVFILFLLGYIFAISIPTIIDRSLSFYILEKLQQRGGGIQLAKFNYIFTTEYMREHRLVDIRLTEQMASGTLTIGDDGCVRLTKKGDYIASFGQFFRKNLLPKKRLVMGGYTEELTDPFKRSDEAPDYLCK